MTEILTLEDDVRTERRYLSWARPGVGIELAHCSSVEQALDEAGLNFDVELQQTYRRNVEESKAKKKAVFEEVPRTFAVARTDTNAVLGTVKSAYKPFQNRDAFGMVNDLIAGEKVDQLTASALDDGSRIMIGAKLSETTTVVGDDFEWWLLFRTTHDGSGSISGEMWAIRRICTNGLSITLPDAKRRWRVSHVSDVRGRLAQAQSSLELGERYRAAFTNQAETLAAAEVDVTLPAISKLVTRTWKTGGDRAHRDLSTALYTALQHSPTIHDDHRGTAWGLLNAFSEHWEHGRQFRSVQAAVKTDIDTLGMKFREAIAELAVAA